LERLESLNEFVIIPRLRRQSEFDNTVAGGQCDDSDRQGHRAARQRRYRRDRPTKLVRLTVVRNLPIERGVHKISYQDFGCIEMMQINAALRSR
jgi:hypothetical protein